MRSKGKPANPSRSAKPQHNHRHLLRTSLIVVAYFFAFIIFDFITKQFQEHPGIVAWYPPAGLTYTLLLTFGWRFGPVVTLALFISSLFIYRMPQPAYLLILWAIIISTIYSAAAAFLRKQIHFDWQLRKFRDVIWFVFTTVLVSALLAVLSVSSSALSSSMPGSEILGAIFHWWIGETVGVLSVAPFLLVYVMPGLKRFAEGQPVRLPARLSFPRPTLSAIGQAASIVLILYWVFGTHVLDEFHPLYLIALPLIWIALTRGFKGISAAILVLNSGVVLALWLFLFNLTRLNELELLMIVNCTVSLLMGAVVTERKQAEESMRESEERYRLLLEFSPDAIVVHSDGKFVYVNPAAERIYGAVNSQELLGKPMLDRVHPDYRKVVKERVQRLNEGKEAVLLEEKFLQLDGTEIEVEVAAIPIMYQGKPAVQMVARDITERKLAEEELKKSEAKFRIIFDNASDGMFIVDLKTRKFFMCNTTCAKMLGYAQEEFLNLDIADIHPREDMAFIFEQIGKFSKGETGIRNDIKFKRKNGSVFIADLSPALLIIGEKEYLLISFIDITERKQAEDEIRQLNIELEERVEERTVELREAQEKLVHQEKLAVLGKIAGSVSHELRNPLSVISTSIYYLKLVQPEAGDIIKRHLAMIEQEVHNSEQILSSLLDFVSTRPVEREWISAATLVNRTLDRYPVPESVKVTLKLPPNLPLLYTDSRQAGQVLGNLITNACQAMVSTTGVEASGKLTISAQRQKEMVAIAVKDCGVGIPLKYMSKLFEPLFSTKARGIGLGLPISQKLAEANGGRIEVESEQGKGSTFTLFLPAWKE